MFHLQFSVGKISLPHLEVSEIYHPESSPQSFDVCCLFSLLVANLPFVPTPALPVRASQLARPLGHPCAALLLRSGSRPDHKPGRTNPLSPGSARPQLPCMLFLGQGHKLCSVVNRVFIVSTPCIPKLSHQGLNRGEVFVGATVFCSSTQSCSRVRIDDSKLT